MRKPPSRSSSPQSLGQLEYVSGMSPMVIALLVLSGLLVLITIILGWVHRDAIKDNEVMLVAFMFGLIPLLCGVYGLKYVLNKQSVKVYNNGFIYKSGGKIQTVFWNDIKEFYEAIVLYVLQGVPVKKREYTVTISGGHKIVLEQNIRNVAKIGERIKKETFNRGFPDAYQRILNGQVVGFGNLTLTKNMIKIKGDEIYLDNIKRIKAFDGKITLKGTSFFGGNDIDYSTTPNAHILYALLTKLIIKN